MLRDPVFSCQASPAPLLVLGMKLIIRTLNYLVVSQRPYPLYDPTIIQLSHHLITLVSVSEIANKENH